MRSGMFDATHETKTRGMIVAAFAIAMIYVGSAIPTPLYSLYRNDFGFPAITITAIYSVYVFGNLAVLFFFGRLSDQIGRRPVTLVAFAFALASTLVFLFAQSTPWLFAARVLSGIAAGLGAGALTAWIAELRQGDRAGSASIASGANLFGLVFGALLAGILAQYAPWPLRLSWTVYAGLIVAIMIALAFAPETIERTAAPLALKPRIGVPLGIRLKFVAPGATAFAAFALGGFYAAIVPGLVEDGLHLHNRTIAGGVVALFFAAGAVTALVSRALRSRTAMYGALALYVPALALLLLAEPLHSPVLLVAASITGGVAMALGYRGSLQVVTEIA
ncbi:MAG TPA: MFS transporter, partial [Rudaea sp.]